LEILLERIDLVELLDNVKRCGWATQHPLLVKYHDEVWGVPVHDDSRLFEFLVLEGAQAGLNWLIILKKRQRYRSAFDSFIPEKVASYSRRDVRRLLTDPGIVRNRLKIKAAINNARKLLGVQKEFGSFDRYIWQFTEGRPLDHRFKLLSDIPAKTAESNAMSTDLRRRGFRFVGSTICYAYMQAVGIANDHLVSCFRHKQLRDA
jgi:DNA-3-methyladenine glycosylase I